jgi:hypothetical protein
MYMPLAEQLALLEEFGLEFHDALTPEYICEKITWYKSWEFDDPAFDALLETLSELNSNFIQDYGEPACLRKYYLDLESYDRPNRYSQVAERLSEMTGTRRQLKLLDENIIREECSTGHGWIEYKFRGEQFRHEHHDRGDWLSEATVMEMANRFSSLEDGFQLYGGSDGQGIRFYYMLKSCEARIEQTLDLRPMTMS